MYVRTVSSDGKTEASRLLWVTSGWLKRFLCIGEVNAPVPPPNFLGGPYLSEARRDISFGVGRGLTSFPFVRGVI